ncbi:MAG: hypothetical protein Q8N91_07055 [Candidatus Omnitrophota bacterium]|nr:hypothetical protein [Candidatus Omnitrophota bacterium]
MARKKKAKAGSKKSKTKIGKAIKRRAVKKARAPRKAASKKRAKAPAKKVPEPLLEKIGKVTHYFPHVKAAAVLILKGCLKVGEEIYVKGHTTDFKEKVTSMQLDRVSIQDGKKGQEIGLLVKSRVRIGDSVYRI